MAAHLSDFVAHYGSLAIFVLMTLESVCIPIPSEVVMPYAGYQAFITHSSITAAVIVATLANVVGGLIAYAIGRSGGRAFVVKYGRYVLLNQQHLVKAEHWFGKYGEWTVFLGRLIPGVRTFISLPAGVAKMSIGKFIIFSALGSLPWNFALTLGGFQLGKHWDQLEHTLKPLTYFGALVLVVAVVWFWFGRRRTQSKSAQSSQKSDLE